MRWMVTRLIIFSTLIISTALPGLAGDENWDTVGLRAGVGDSKNDESFSQYEVYLTFSLPWKWESDSKWMIGSFIGANAGAIICENNAFVGSMGPGVYIMPPAKRFVLSAGIYPTYIGRSRFGTEDFGESFQFTSAVGINYIFFQHMTVGYRFQHMSNAGLSDENPGLNNHMIEMGYRF